MSNPWAATTPHLSPERVRELRLAEAAEQKDAEREQAAREAKSDQRFVDNLRRGHRPHSHQELLAVHQAAEARQEAQQQRERERQAAERQLRHEREFWKARADGRPHGHEAILQWYAATPGPLVETGPVKERRPSPEQQVAAQHESDIVETKQEVSALSQALTKLKGRLSGQGVDPLGRRKH